MRSGRLKGPGSRPYPRLPEGTETIPQIEHIVVVMMENQSFDNVLGMVPHRFRRRRRVDGLPVFRGRPLSFNRDAQGKKYFSVHADTPCQFGGIPSQAWNPSHTSFDNGRNDGFVLASGPVAMRFFDDSDLPFIYSLARHFPIGQRYFSSALAQTYPNFRYLMTGTSSGVIRTDSSTFSTPAANGTIFDRFDHRGRLEGLLRYPPGARVIPNLAKPPAARGSSRACSTSSTTPRRAGCRSSLGQSGL